MAAGRILFAGSTADVERRVPVTSTTQVIEAHDFSIVPGFVDAQPEANAKRIGAVGYCMSGPFVMHAAATFPDRIQSIASIHGA